MYFVDPYSSLNQSVAYERRYHKFDEDEHRLLNQSYAIKSEKRREDSLSTLETTVYSYSSRKKSRPGSAPARKV